MTPEELARIRKGRPWMQYPLPPRPPAPKSRRYVFSKTELALLVGTVWILSFVAGIWWGTVSW